MIKTNLEQGAPAEKIRFPLANGTLVRVPERYANDDDTLKSLLLLTDVMEWPTSLVPAIGHRLGTPSCWKTCWPDIPN